MSRKQNNINTQFNVVDTWCTLYNWRFSSFSKRNGKICRRIAFIYRSWLCFFALTHSPWARAHSSFLFALSSAVDLNTSQTKLYVYRKRSFLLYANQTITKSTFDIYTNSVCVFFSVFVLSVRENVRSTIAGTYVRRLQGCLIENYTVFFWRKRLIWSRTRLKNADFNKLWRIRKPFFYGASQAHRTARKKHSFCCWKMIDISLNVVVGNLYSICVSGEYVNRTRSIFAITERTYSPTI